jgi:hypothetical protein
VALASVAATLSAARPMSYVPKPHHRCRSHYRRESKTIKRRTRGRTINARIVECVYAPRRMRRKKGATPAAALPYLRFRWSGGRFAPPWQSEPADGVASSLILPEGSSTVGLMTTGSSYGPNASSQMTAAWVGSENAYAGMKKSGSQVQGEGTWYHVSLLLPRGRDCFTRTGQLNASERASDCWFPTTGQWNWLTEWHIDDHTWDYGVDSTYMGVFSDYPTQVGVTGRHARLVMVLRGGNSIAQTEQDVELSSPLRYNHWYSMTFHFVWSTSSLTGLAQWWVDGARKLSRHVATLYSNPDGTVSYNTFGVYNYHLAAPWNDMAEFKDIAIGPTRASVAG